MSESYTGVRVVEAKSEVISQVYTNKVFGLIRNSDGTLTPAFDKRLKFYPNEFILLQAIIKETTTALTRVWNNELSLITVEKDHCPINGLSPRNKEQHMALDILMDDNVPIIAMTGRAGTGKTLLTLAAALAKVDQGKYDRIILTKPMSWVGKHGLGALPGDIHEKFNPYLENYMCNIEHMLNGRRKSVPDLIDQYKIDLIPLQLIRGASWHNAFVIADEVQTLDYHEMVTLGTRLGEGSKLVLMGDMGQRDENIAKDKTGLWKFMNDERSKKSYLAAAIELWKCERSETAALFANVFEV